MEPEGLTYGKADAVKICSQCQDLVLDCSKTGSCLKFNCKFDDCTCADSTLCIDQAVPEDEYCTQLGPTYPPE